MNTVPNSQTLTVPLAAHTWSKTAIQLIGLGITAALGMGIGGIASSTTFTIHYSKTSQTTLREWPDLQWHSVQFISGITEATRFPG